MLAKGTVGVDDISMLQLIGLFVGLASAVRCIDAGTSHSGLPWTQLILLQLDTSNGFVVHEISCPFALMMHSK